MMNDQSSGSRFRTQCLSQPDSGCYRSLLVLTILAGLGLRLAAVWYAQGYHHFMINDEVNALGYILAWLNGDEHAWYLAQPAFNEGKLPGPLWTLFGVVLFKLGGNTAEGALYWMAFINSLTVFFIYRLARQLFTPALALATAAIYALAPWTIYYSYGLYNPVPLDLIGVLLFLAVWQTINNHKSRQVFWVPLLCAVIPQFHMIGVFIAPAVLLVLLLSVRRLNWRWFAMGVVAGIVLYLPYLIGDMQNGWQNLRAMASSSEVREYSASVLKIITAPATVLSSVPAGWSGDGLEPIKEYGDRWFGAFAVLAVLAVWTLLHSFVFLFHFARRVAVSISKHNGRVGTAMKAEMPVMFIGLLVLVPLLLFLLTGHNFSTRYAIILFPLLFLLPGLFLQSLDNPRAKKYWFGSLLIIGLFNLYLVGSYYAHQQQRFAENQEFMPSFRTLATIHRTLESESGSDRSFNVILSPQLQETLPHFDYKLVYTIQQYVRFWQESPRARERPADITYIIESAEGLQPGRVVYRHGNIVIRRAAGQ